MKRQMAPCPQQGKRDSLRTIWKIPGADPDLYIVREQDQRACEDPLNPAVAFRLIDRWAADRNARGELLQLYEALRAPHLGHNVSDTAIEQSVKPRLRQAFQGGELLLIRVPPRGMSQGAVEALVTSAAAPTSAPPPRQTAKTWVELRLVDMEGNPVSRKRYVIQTPSGALEEGNLDSSGRVRLNNIDPGSCIFTFPDLDLEAWERAG